MGSIIGYIIGFALGAIIGSSIMRCVIVKMDNYKNNPKKKDKKKKKNIKDWDSNIEPYIIATGVAPYDGAIYRWCKADGAYAKKGETVLIYESLKMEFEVKSPVEGYIKRKSSDLDLGYNKNDVLFGITPMQIAQ